VVFKAKDSGLQGQGECS